MVNMVLLILWGCGTPSEFTVVLESEQQKEIFDSYVQNLKSDSFVVDIQTKVTEQPYQPTPAS